MKIGTIAHPVTMPGNKIKWFPFAELHYDFSRPEGWASVVVEQYGRIYTGTFVCRFQIDEPEPHEAPYIKGDIMTCTSQKGRPSRIGRIYTNMDEHGNFKDYRGMFDACIPLVPAPSENGNYVYPIFQERA